MVTSRSVVSTVDELHAAVGKADAKRIVIQGHLANVQGFSLSPGQVLEGKDQQAAITFAPDQDGLRLSTDNSVCNLRLETTPRIGRSTTTPRSAVSASYAWLIWRPSVRCRSWRVTKCAAGMWRSLGWM